jgi:hypothetical protein
MKKCQTCNFENSDNMRFCLECGTPLPDAPIVVNLGGSQSDQKTAAYGNSMETLVNKGDSGGNRGSFGNNFPNQFSNAPIPPTPKSGGNKKIYLIVGGIAVLLLLVFTAIAGIVGYNMLKDDVVVNPTPTPGATTPKASASPTSAKKSPTPTDSPDDTPEKADNDDTTNKEGQAEVDKVWVDYNVSEGGKKGMRIHVKFTVHDLKDTDSYLAIYFQKANGDKLYTNDKTYRSTDGQVAVYKTLKPAYKDTSYDDSDLFIPYEEFSLGKGKYDLKMDIDVIYKNGDLFKHMKYYDFTYTEG